MKRYHQALVCFPIAALALSLLAASPQSALGAAPGSATITNAGAGDFSGFRIDVLPNGHANAVDGAGHASNDLPYDIVQQFFKDLSAAAPLVETPSRPCAASADDASRTGASVSADISISWNGRRWNNLKCATDSRLIKIAGDAKAIEQALYVQAYRARPMYVYMGAYASGQALYVGAPTGGYSATGATGGYSSQPFSSLGYHSSPYSGYPSGSMPAGSLPTSGVSGGLPSATLPGTSPYTGLPSASLPYSSPYGSGPFGASPYGGSL